MTANPELEPVVCKISFGPDDKCEHGSARRYICNQCDLTAQVSSLRAELAERDAINASLTSEIQFYREREIEEKSLRAEAERLKGGADATRAELANIRAHYKNAYYVLLQIAESENHTRAKLLASISIDTTLPDPTTGKQE